MISRILSADNARYAEVAVTEDVYDDAPTVFDGCALRRTPLMQIGALIKWQLRFRSVKGAGSSKGIFDGSGDAAYFKGKTPPYWARIVRTGDQIKGYVQNADGSWGDGKGGASPLRTVSFSGVPSDTPVYAGVAMMGLKVSGVSPVKNNWSAQFDNFSLPNYPLPVAEGVPVSFPVKTVDLDKDPVAVTISNTTLPSGARYGLQDGKFTWSNPRAGTYQVTFAASDGEAEAKPMTIVFKVKASSEVNKSELEM